MIKQIFVPYWKWECYKSKMYNKISKEDEDIKKELCFNLMNDTKEFSRSMSDVVKLWNLTMLNHLSNKSLNRKAFVGQCACYYKHQIPEYIARQVWKSLTKEKSILANNEAIKHIKRWEYKIKLNNILNYGNQDVIKREYQMKLQFK